MAIPQLSMGRVNWQCGECILNWAVPLGVGLFLFLAAPLRAAFHFGDDEGFELMKGLLVSMGHPLYREIWNDQPPLHTELLALFFRLFGPSACVGRLLTVVFAMAFVGALFQIVKQSSGVIAGIVAVLLLVSSSQFLQLSVSVMLELPAMAVATGSLWAWMRYRTGENRWWLVVAGTLLGCALQVKLTTAIFLPMLLVDYLVTWKTRQNRPPRADSSRFWDRRLEAPIAILSSLAVFVSITVLFYRIDTWLVFFGAHFSDATREVAAKEGFDWRPATLLEDWALAGSASLGLAVAAWKRCGRVFAPLALLFTVMLVHSWHRPFWPYYRLHFAIPMAWLGAIGIVEWIRALWLQPFARTLLAKVRVSFGLLLWSAVLSLTVTSALERFWNELAAIRFSPPASENGLVRILKEYAAETAWVFTNERTAAFWAGLPIPPELAVIPSKRIWSGQISSAEVVEHLERYRPELILLSSDWVGMFALSEYLAEHYRPDRERGLDGLFVRIH